MNDKFKEIQEANQTIITKDIQGKEYAEVNQRIKAFRMVYPLGTIHTEILKMEDGVVTMQSVVRDDTGRELGSGMAQEKEGSSFINKTSFIENCETSAVGRALGMCGFGIDTSVCSAEELENAKLNQGRPAPSAGDRKAATEILLRSLDALKNMGVPVDSDEFAKYVIKNTGIKDIVPDHMTVAQLKKANEFYLNYAQKKAQKDGKALDLYSTEPSM